MEGCNRRTEVTTSHGLTSAPGSACGVACIDRAEIEHVEPPKRTTAIADNATAAGDADGAAEHFADALAMLAKLPLTDAERAEAVRRLLVDLDRSGDTAKTGGTAAPLSAAMPVDPTLPDGMPNAAAGRRTRNSGTCARK